jgi:hypothetical protein
VIELNDLIRAEDVGKGPWKVYIFNDQGFHEGGLWFRAGAAKYPAEEISFSRAKQFADVAVGKGFEVRICDGMDHLVFHSENGKIVHGNTFWNEAKPDPAAVAVADRLKGKVSK